MNSHSQQLLIVGAQPAELQTLSGVFTDEGFEVSTCATSEAAFERCRDQSFAVAILNLPLAAPSADGSQLLSQLRQVHPGIRVIVCAAGASSEAAKHATNLGAFAYVIQSADPASLARQVNRAARDQLAEALTHSKRRYRKQRDLVPNETLRESEVRFRQLAENRRHAGLAVDVTERNQARVELEASEAKFRTIVETTQEWIWEIDRQGIHTYSNPGVERILGYAADEIVGQPSLPLIHEEDRIEVEKRLPEAIRNRQGWTGWVIRWRHRDGSIRYLESNAVPIINDLGEFCGYRGADRDITARLNAEAAVRDSERALAKAQQIANIGSWEFDLATGQPTGSAELLRMIGHVEGEPLPTIESFLADFVHPHDAKSITASLQGTLISGLTNPVEFRILCRPDRRVRYVRAEAEAVLDQAGNLRKIIGTLQDISQQKKADLALRESEEKFRVLSEKSPAIVLIAEAERIVYGNNMLATVTGYTRDELLQMSPLDLIHPDFRELVAERHLGRLNGESHPNRYEIKFVTKEGEDRWVDLSAQRVEMDGRPAVLVTCVNITERKLAEKLRYDMQEQLSHVSRLSTMGEMVAGIAHELNQPLSAIANFALACKNTVKANRCQYDVPIDAWLQDVHDQSVRCGEIIRGLRDFVAKHDLGWKLVDLNRVVRDSIALMRSDLLHQTVAIECRLPQSAPQVHASQVQLQQVLVNLLRNACDATSTTTAPEIAVEIDCRDGRVDLTVADNGMGVDEPQREKLFEAFFTTKPDGMGMGLAISKSIVEAHGGRLRFEPGTTAGSTFHIEFPQAQTLNAATEVQLECPTT